MELTNALSRVPRALDALEQLTRKEHAGSQRQGRPGGALVDAAAWPSGGQAAAAGVAGGGSKSESKSALCGRAAHWLWL